MINYKSSIVHIFLTLLLLLIYTTYHTVASRLSKQKRRPLITEQFLLSSLFLALSLAYTRPEMLEAVLIGGFSLSLAIAAWWFSNMKSRQNFLAPVETPSLILSCFLGLLIALNSRNLLLLYLGLEMYTISLFAFSAYRSEVSKRQELLESIIKYFVISSIMTGMYLMGASLLYSSASSFAFTDIMHAEKSLFFRLGSVMFLLSICGKIAAAPFHFWAPSFYRSASTFVLIISGSVSKFAISAILVLITFKLFPESISALHVIGIVSLMVGAFGGLVQKNIRSLLGYSGICSAGFVILGINSHSPLPGLHYAFVYSILSFFPLALLLMLFSLSKDKIESLSDFSGIARQNPVTAITISGLLLSMAGLPPFAGFFAKIKIIESLIESESFIAIAALILSSVITCFYYVRIISYMFFRNATNKKYIVNFDTIGSKCIFLTCMIFLLFSSCYFMYYEKVYSLLFYII